MNSSVLEQNRDGFSICALNTDSIMVLTKENDNVVLCMNGFEEYELEFNAKELMGALNKLMRGSRRVS